MLSVEVVSVPVERIEADVVVVGCLSDERPLRGAAARADWRLCGALSHLIVEGGLAGAVGEAALLSSPGGLRAPRLLALGLGPRGRRPAERLEAYAADALARLVRLRAETPALALLPLDHGSLEVQLEGVLTGLAEAVGTLEAPLVLRLVVGRDAADQLHDALEHLAGQHWPDGLELRH